MLKNSNYKKNISSSRINITENDIYFLERGEKFLEQERIKRRKAYTERLRNNRRRKNVKV